MPIKPLVLQRRHAELGRIRLGYQAETRNGKTRPAKLETFRFTSVSERYIRDLATLYGGEARPWDNGGIASWEVYTEAKTVPVIAVKGGLSQWLETWSGGGCIHRCDGETNVLTGEPCDLREQVRIGRDTVNPHEVARPTTRLSLMLPELEAIGVWRCETKGWNAAAEIPAVAELAQYVGDLVPAHLNLQERRAIKDGQTSRFVVPVLDLQIGTARLREIVAEKSGTAALGAGSGSSAGTSAPSETSAPALAPASPASPPADEPAARGTGVNIPTPEQIAGADLTVARKMLAYLEHHVPDHPATAAARDRVAALDPDGAVDAAVVDDPAPALSDGEPAPDPQPGADADQVWQQILKVGGEQGMTLPDVEEDYARFAGGVMSSEASASELTAYLHHLQAAAGQAVPA